MQLAKRHQSTRELLSSGKRAALVPYRHINSSKSGGLCKKDLGNSPREALLPHEAHAGLCNESTRQP